MTDWLAALDIQQGARNVRSDTVGDWYRDPWAWPEIEWIASSAPHFLTARLNDSGARRTLPFDVPKENFVLRPATLLDPLDRLAYQALVDSLSLALIGDLRDFVFGWRLPIDKPIRGSYDKNSLQWQRFRERLRELGDGSEFGLSTDIVSFFQSVQTDRLVERIRQRVGNNAVVGRIASYLDSWGKVPARGGLPQRCLASSVLAQLCIRSVDDLLSLHMAGTASRSGKERVSACRWMDDIWIFSEKRAAIRAAQLDLQVALWDLGLNLNAGKTNLWAGEDLVRTISEYEHSAADFGLRHEDKDALEQLIKRLLDEPETVPRTTIYFVTSRMRIHHLDIRLDDFVEIAPRLPHGADHLARLFRDMGTWHDLQDWYIQQIEGPGQGLDWTAYQLGTMFPSGEAVPTILHYFKEKLVKAKLPLLMVPLVIQRLASWEPDETRGLIQSLTTEMAYSHPFALRAFAFAGLQVGVAPATVRTLLQQFTETEVQLALVEDRGFKPLGVAPDFGGDH